MKVKIKKVVSMFMIFAIILSQQPLGSFAADDTVGRDEFSQIYTNYDLSQTAELFPYSLFKQNIDTLKWEQKQNVEVDSGAISYASEAEPENNFSLNNEVKVGKDTDGQFETYIKFGNNLPALNGGLFLGAKLRLKELNNEYGCYYCQYYTDEQFSIHKILEPWSANDLTWANKPGISESPISSKTTAMPVNGAYFTWDVSGLVLDWYKNPGSYFGLALKDSGTQSNTYLRTFSKLNSNLIQVPVLQVQYSPKPKAPSGIANSLQANSGKGKINLQWSSVTGAKGYRVYLYNGKEFEQVYDGAATSWSSFGKNLWPTNDQINNGDVALRKDGLGTDLSDNPGLVYQRLGDTGRAADTYYFRISAYNEYVETELSDEAAVKMPDTTAPTVPENIKASDELISHFTLTWDPLMDKSQLKYNVKITTESGYQVFSGTSETNSITVPERYLLPRETYKVSVMAVDMGGYQSNYSAYSSPVTVTAREKMDAQFVGWSAPISVQEAGSTPNVKIVLKNMGVEPWTQAGGYQLKANGADFLIDLASTDTIKPGEIKTFEFKLPANMPLGTTQIIWQMYNQNTGYFGSSCTMAVTFEDRMGPQISLVSPADNQRINGKIRIEGSISDFQLKKYSVFYGYGESPVEWIPIKEAEGSIVDLGEWETTNLKIGAYKLRIEAEDASGNQSTLERNVYVYNPVPTPAGYEITDQSTLVTGTAKPGTTILIFKNGEQLVSGLVNKDGTFSIPITRQSPDTKIKIISMDGYYESNAVTIRVKDVTPPEQPLVQTITNKTSVITGKTEPSALVMVRVPDRTVSGKADSAGNFSISIPIQNYGTAISITVQDGAQLQSIEKKILVSRVALNIPSVNAVTNKAAQVTGKTEKYAVVTVGIGTRSYSAKADVYGNYKVAIPIQNSGTKLNITAKDTAGNISATRSVTVSRVAPNTPVVNVVNNKSSYVSGKTEKYAIVIAKIDLKTYSTKADAYGNYKIAIPIQNSGIKIYITAKDTAGNISAAASVTVARVAPNIPLVNAVRYYSTTVSGKTERYVAVSVRIGTRVYSAKSDYYGNFKVSIPKQRIGTKLTVTAKDAKGLVSSARTVTVY
ncbi:Ig-like domain-containing protein [Bacillus sp. ISL-7]|uniref:Ig-like domain-containing protein n=1 Tax=Bacillus sp. ISL-7 TaxID=2819136 RepID=UPI001BE945FF|nr:Ig-like domain-containing protein [Bacillus sp. ISL-7]MBT2739025.1 DNRLRE domain-containing protein [Bacillus sp. ISL-7]